MPQAENLGENVVAINFDTAFPTIYYDFLWDFLWCFMFYDFLRDFIFPQGFCLFCCLIDHCAALSIPWSIQGWPCCKTINFKRCTMYGKFCSKKYRSPKILTCSYFLPIRFLFVPMSITPISTSTGTKRNPRSLCHESIFGFATKPANIQNIAR